MNDTPTILPTGSSTVLGSATPVLSARALRKSYGQTVALADVDVRFHAGESIAVMGASGSGKTTLLHCLAAVTSPDSGSVVLQLPDVPPVEVSSLDEQGRSAVRRSLFGFVFQQGLLLPELTAIENVALPLMVQGTTRKDAEAVAGPWLAALGLAGMEDRRIGQLSGGQSQRVAIARAQVTGAPVVFADEPTGALDSETSAEVMTALLTATTGQGRTLVVVTHDETVARRCDRILAMRDGRIVGEERVR